ncbi:flagellar hook-length control protein FliK [Hyphomicrobium sp. CS1GBMeth3]|uniref:flagellar hook-length control protein FliK n=1 Tax=Hyphomicrobium sp. CS1GBMeth3 TaxID=1892845 RepID=UPI00111475BE|nr:flagellar hook-length control protein FliK [Hyphomicrobium sp. CS1GBMeth3]
MSTAQAVTSGVSSPSAGARAANSGSVDRGDTSFRETLETASRSGDGHTGDRIGDESAREHKAGSERGGSDRDQAAAAPPDAVRQDVLGAAELAHMLAELGVTPFASGAEAAAAAGQRRSLGSDTTGSAMVEAAPLLPGAVQDENGSLDAEQLRALLKSGAAGLPAAEEDPIALKAKVTRQETHLALGRASSTAVDAAFSDGDAVGLASVAAQAAEDASLPRRATPETQTGAAGASRGSSIAEDWSRGAAFAEPGIGGQDGRQSEGRGSSGAGAQQQGSGAFVAMVAGSMTQAVGAVGEAHDMGFGPDPVSDQIADHVHAELKADGIADGASDGAVKVLELELKPANLGAVTVRLALKDNVISIHIEAQRLDTLAVIEREREALAGALASAGYSVDGITAAPQSDVNRQAVSLVAQGDAGASASQGGPQGQSGQGQGLGSSSGGQGRQSDAGAGAYQAPSGDKDNGGAGIRREAGGIYV